WNKLNELIDETNSVPTFAAQTYTEFTTEESGYYDKMLPVIYDLPIPAPAPTSVITANSAYEVAFKALADYLNNGSAWSSGAPLWISDAQLSTTTNIVGATFRTNFKNYYDAKTALLNAIAVRAKDLADAAQATAGVGFEHAATLHAPSDADHTQTTIDGGLVTTGTLQVVQGGTVAAGITGNTAGDTAVRFFAGSTFANRNTAPFRVLQNGSIFATSATVSGTITCGTGSKIAGFTATTTDLTAGTSTNAIGISTDTSKKAFWAGNATPASSPFYVSHNGTGKIGGFVFASNGLSATSSVSIGLGTYNTSVNVFNAGVTDIDALGLATKAVLSTNSGVWAISTIACGQVSCGYRDGSTSNYSSMGGLNRNGDGISNAPFQAGVASGLRYGFWTNGKVDAAGGFTALSDERLKRDIVEISVLDRLTKIRVMQYRHDDNKIKQRLHDINKSSKTCHDHFLTINAESTMAEDSQIRIGAMAAEFNAAFGVNNNSEESVCLNDQIGV
ncbi:MAG: hypothetical protein EOM80_18765, partial [Erysipelotrichia bacterium]|nr:hypothetical protein [Erysipelotrichia bacterium]